MTARKKSKRPLTVATLADVARRAGVGESTVSRVLRDKGSFSQRTREKVLKAAGNLGYVPNRIAGTLASAGSRLVGIIIPSLANTAVPDVLRGANSVLEDAGFQSVIGVSNYDPAREENLIKSILSWRPAGLIVTGLEHTECAKAMMKRSGARIVELLDIDGDGIDIVVGYSNKMAGRRSAEYLLAQNYRRIGYVGNDVNADIRAGKRLDAFRDTLMENGLTIVDQECCLGPSYVETGRVGLAKLLGRNPNLDAIYFSNDELAIGGYFHCVANGISVPGELALFGYNGLDIARQVPQPLSTIRTPLAEIGETGARLLFSGGSAEVVDLGFELIPGATA